MVSITLITCLKINLQKESITIVKFKIRNYLSKFHEMKPGEMHANKLGFSLIIEFLILTKRHGGMNIWILLDGWFQKSMMMEFDGTNFYHRTKYFFRWRALVETKICFDLTKRKGLDIYLFHFHSVSRGISHNDWNNLSYIRCTSFHCWKL